MRKMLLSLGALAAVGIIVLGAASEALAARVTADLNVRRGPGVHYARIGVVPAGRHVDVIECIGRWCQIEYRGLVGWVSARYLAEDGYYYTPLPRVYPAPPYHYGWPRRPRPPYSPPPGGYPPPPGAPKTPPDWPPGAPPNPPGPPGYWRR